MVSGAQRSMRVDVPCDLAAMAAARQLVVDHAGAWGFPALGELEVVVSELVTNAIVHAHSSAQVECSMAGDGGIDLVVGDHTSAMPSRRTAEPGDTDGRGLAIVEALCQSWGTIDVPGNGKQVWAHLGATPA